MARRATFDVKKDDLRIEVRAYDATYRPAIWHGRELDWKENTFEVDHRGTPFTASLHDRCHRVLFRVLIEAGQTSTILRLRRFAHMGY